MDTDEASLEDVSINGLGPSKASTGFRMFVSSEWIGGSWIFSIGIAIAERCIERTLLRWKVVYVIIVLEAKY